MFGRSVRVARVAGIPVGVSPWWLAVVALFTWTLGSSYFPEAVPGIAPAASYGLGLASVLLLFASLLLHEFGHAIVARRHGVEVEEIDLWLLGGVARLRGEAQEADDELRYALAGPAVSALITACFGLLALLLPTSVPREIRALVDYQFLVNALIVGFNLIPAFPLDGGRVLRALLWRRTGSMERATDVAARVGRAFGYALVGLGALLLLGSYAYDGIWLAFIGVFIVTSARQQAAGAEIRAAFSGQRAADVMARPVVSIPAALRVDVAAREYFARYPYTAFPVVDAAGRAVGLITIDRVAAADTRHAGASRVTAPPALRVADATDRDPSLLVAEDADVIALLERPAFASVGRAVVVDADGRPVGLVSISDVQRLVRGARLRVGGGQKPRPGERPA
jgi:Zn-dependent protease/CBS domain-containing protein